LSSNSQVREILTTGSMSALLDGTFAIFYLAFVFVVSVPLALIALTIALLQALTMVASWRRNQRLTSESLQFEANTQSYAYELLAGIETLKASGAQQRAAEHWGGLFIDQTNISLTRGRLNALVESVMSTLQLAAPLLILLGGAYMVLNGSLSLGEMFGVAALAAGFLQPLSTLVNTGLQLQRLGSYMERINDVLDTPREQTDGQRRIAPRLAGHIRGDHVSFRYGPTSPTVVNDVSLEVHPGQHIGIVGRSGSGKSTLAHLLLGLYTPTCGRIEFDGVDLSGFDATSVRRQLGIVTQHPYLFASSIRENVALTNPALSLDSVVEAAKIACIHEDIAVMPMGYDTQVHDGGSSLSGGQRQRLALARALVHRPSILLLDEATSELDTYTEQLVYENLATLSATTIVIAHRLSTIRNADVILVMDGGKIVESGTHDELLAMAGIYRKLIGAQANGQGSMHAAEFAIAFDASSTNPDLAPQQVRPSPRQGDRRSL
jgi:ATP-binding cassette, subfamily B, bacterial